MARTCASRSAATVDIARDGTCRAAGSAVIRSRVRPFRTAFFSEAEFWRVPSWFSPNQPSRAGLLFPVRGERDSTRATARHRSRPVGGDVAPRRRLRRCAPRRARDARRPRGRARLARRTPRGSRPRRRRRDRHVVSAGGVRRRRGPATRLRGALWRPRGGRRVRLRGQGGRGAPGFGDEATPGGRVPGRRGVAGRAVLLPALLEQRRGGVRATSAADGGGAARSRARDVQRAKMGVPIGAANSAGAADGEEPRARASSSVLVPLVDARRRTRARRRRARLSVRRA